MSLQGDVDAAVGQGRQGRGNAVLLGVLVLYLLASGIWVFARESETRSWPLPGSDFDVFFDSGRLITSAYRDRLYEPEGRAAVPPASGRNAAGNYYNPPLLAYLYSPLTFMSVDTARTAAVWVAVAGAMAMAAVACAWTKDWLVRAVIVLALASFWPAAESIVYGHPSLLFAALATLGLFLLERGRSRAAGLLIALLALKPALVVAPLGLLAWREDRRALAAAAVGLLLFVLLPYVPSAESWIPDHQRLLSASRNDAFTFDGSITAGAKWMFNWNGFIARLLDTDPRPIIVFPLYLVTALLTVRVWMKGTLRESWLAAAIATTLCVPHFLFYDQVVLLPAALAVALECRARLLVLALVLCHLAVNVSMSQMVPAHFDRAFLVSAPALFALLAVLASKAEIAAWLDRHAPAAAGFRPADASGTSA